LAKRANPRIKKASPRAAAAARIEDPNLGPIGTNAYPELGKALRSRIKPVLKEWEKLVRRMVPPASDVSFDDVLDHLPEILTDMADALASDDPAEVKRLMDRSPEQGIHRFQLHYEVRELATEDRLLRFLAINHVDEALGRRMNQEEDRALNWAMDLMVQQAMVAFVDHQNERLREGAEAELKFLSFLSHDLSGNLSNITVWLQVLKRRLAALPQFENELSAVNEAQQAILDTIGGMGKLLQAERLRHRGVQPRVEDVNLNQLCAAVAHVFAQEAQTKGLVLELRVPRDASVRSDAELIRLVLQNLIGNAVKFSTRGVVRVVGEQNEDGREGAWTIEVSDKGPGIAPEHREHIFAAFGRGDVHGQSGVGLGLAIAARAAKLLVAELTMESKLGVGSTFRLALPTPAEADSPLTRKRRRI
jgi:signal transduction histidine kinase